MYADRLSLRLLAGKLDKPKFKKAIEGENPEMPSGYWSNPQSVAPSMAGSQAGSLPPSAPPSAGYVCRKSRPLSLLLEVGSVPGSVPAGPAGPVVRAGRRVPQIDPAGRGAGRVRAGARARTWQPQAAGMAPRQAEAGPLGQRPAARRRRGRPPPRPVPDVEGGAGPAPEEEPPAWAAMPAQARCWAYVAPAPRGA